MNFFIDGSVSDGHFMFHNRNRMTFVNSVIGQLIHGLPTGIRCGETAKYAETGHVNRIFRAIFSHLNYDQVTNGTINNRICELMILLQNERLESLLVD